MDYSTMRQFARAALSLMLFQSTVLGQANITQDSYFYGQSPPVYPSRNVLGKVNSNGTR
jgi:hypothetical protein